MNWLQKISHDQGEQVIRALIPEICKKVQAEYDAWDQSDSEFGDGELGFGGICQNFAEIMSDVLNSHGIDATTVSAQCGEQHVWTIAKLNSGVYEVDIPFHIYERGGGYNWKKIPDVKFDESSVSIFCLSKDPNEFEDYIE